MTQKDIILKELQENGSLTSWDAIKKFSITRLGAHIHTLRQEGHKITSVVEMKGQKHWVRYFLTK